MCHRLRGKGGTKYQRGKGCGIAIGHALSGVKVQRVQKVHRVQRGWYRRFAAMSFIIPLRGMEPLQPRLRRDGNAQPLPKAAYILPSEPARSVGRTHWSVRQHMTDRTRAPKAPEPFCFREYSLLPSSRRFVFISIPSLAILTEILRCCGDPAEGLQVSRS